MAAPKLVLTILAVDDLSRSVTFYRSGFGWRQTVDAPVYSELELPDGNVIVLARPLEQVERTRAAATASRETASWELVPLRVPTGWAVRWNGLEARFGPGGEVLEVSDSEDLLWITKLPPPETGTFETDPGSPWRELGIDVGWYRDHFRTVVLDPDWDHVAESHETSDLDEVRRRVEELMARSWGEPRGAR
jgi:catechol 2,3-dioxygenase-like lactoylglutathione lyase family enzyme